MSFPLLLRRGGERCPLLWISLLAVAGVVTADGFARSASASVWIGAFAIALLSGAIFAGRRWKFALLALILAATAGTAHGWRLHRQTQAFEHSRSELNAVLRIVSTPKASGRGWSAMGRDSSGAGWWVRGQGTQPDEGATLSLSGRFEEAALPRNPGQFDFRDYLLRKGASGIFRARGEAAIVAPPSWLDRATSGTRAAFREAITQGLDPASPETAVIAAMVLGEIPPDPQIVEPFRTSGTLHAFSVSGMHVVMLGAIFWFVLGRLGLSYRWAAWVLIAVMTAYVWITGMSPPAQRALTMAIVVLAGFLLRRPPGLANSLGFALLAAMLLDGHLIFMPGVQLSFGVVAAIALGSGPLTRRLAWISAMEPYLPQRLYNLRQRIWWRSRQRLAGDFAMSISATAGSLPLLIWHFGLASPVSILAGIIMAPAISVLMALALLSASVGFLKPVSATVNQMNGKVARFCIREAEISSELPAGHFQVPLGRPGRDFMLICDPGEATSATILHDSGATLLFDTASEFGFKNVVAPSLQHLALTPEALVLTMPDASHLGGTLPSLDAFPIHQVLLPVDKARSPAFTTLLQTLDSRNIAHLVAHGEQSYPLSGKATLEIIRAAGPEMARASANERALITRLNWHGWRILFTSSATLTAENALLASGTDISADVIVMGRRGRDPVGGDAFLAAVHPQAIIAAEADFPSEAQIPEDWLAACEAQGIRVISQGRTGAIFVIPGKDGSLEIRGYLDDSSLLLKR